LCTACIFTQCSKAIAGLVFNTVSTESSDFADGSATQSDGMPGLDESETSPGENIAEESDNSGDFGDGFDSIDSSSGWDDYDSSGMSGDAINFKIEYEFLIPGDTESIAFTACIPSDYKYRQKIKDYGFSVRPDRIFTDDSNRYVLFKLINPVNKFFISMDIQMELFDFDLLAAQKTPGNLISGSTDKDMKLLAEYLVSEAHLESDDLQIEAAADSFNNSRQLELVSSIYSFVLDRMQYAGYNPSDIGAAAALASGSGDCTEYSDLFVALCRAKGIPARVIEGYAADAGPADLRFGHNWAEVYLDDFGWVPFDPIYDDNNGSSAETTFENLKNIYIYTGFKRNDDVLLGYHYYAYNCYGDNIEVKKTVTIN
jgi:transglutaminase-like putative cysteine protease